MLGAALRAPDMGLLSKSEPSAKWAQYLTPCSLLIIGSSSVIVEGTCTFFC